jgi:hypothetical protein
MTSYGNFKNAGSVVRFRLGDIDRQTSFDRFAEMAHQIFHRVALRGAARNRGDLGPKAALLRVMYDDFNSQLRKSLVWEAMIGAPRLRADAIGET